MAIAWSRISSKVIAHPPEADAVCSRRCGNGKSRVGACIPQMVDKRKQEVLGAHDVEVTPFSQTQGGICHVHVGRLQPPKTHAASRSAPCPLPNETSKSTQKPSHAVVCKRKNAMSTSNAKPSAISTPCTKPSTMWACLMTSSSRSKPACTPKRSCSEKSSASG